MLVIESNTLRRQWPLGKVIEIVPSAADNVVRVLKVKLVNHKNPFIRPVTKLCVLATAKEQGINVKMDCTDHSIV